MCVCGCTSLQLNQPIRWGIPPCSRDLKSFFFFVLRHCPIPLLTARNQKDYKREIHRWRRWKKKKITRQLLEMTTGTHPPNESRFPASFRYFPPLKKELTLEWGISYLRWHFRIPSTLSTRLCALHENALTHVRHFYANIINSTIPRTFIRRYSKENWIQFPQIFISIVPFDWAGPSRFWGDNWYAAISSSALFFR